MLVLPKGQFDTGEMPAFGLTKFAERIPFQTHPAEIFVSGEVENELVLSKQLKGLERTTIGADFHCVTTWSCRGLEWEGVLFKDVFQYLIQPEANPAASAQFVILRALDGARASLPLVDLLKSNVLIADRLNGKPLSANHGAPLRLVAPDHYGYKSIKYLNNISFHRNNHGYRPSGYWFMEHPRARVAFEERGRLFPGWLLRYAYRPLVKPTKRLFADAIRRRTKEPK